MDQIEQRNIRNACEDVKMTPLTSSFHSVFICARCDCIVSGYLNKTCSLLKIIAINIIIISKCFIEQANQKNIRGIRE